MQFRRFVASFEGLNSSLAQSPGELWSCRDLPNVGKLYFQRKIHLAPKVLIAIVVSTVGIFCDWKCHSYSCLRNIAVHTM